MMTQRRETRARTTLKLALAAIVLGSTAPPTSAQDAIPPVIELRRAETLGIDTSPLKAVPSKVDAALLALHAEYQAYLKQTSAEGAAALVFRSRDTIAPIAGGSVVIDTAASGNPQALAADLRALGAHKVAVFGRMVSGRLPMTVILALKDLSSLQFARPAYAATRVGRVTSQGDAAMRADMARITFDVDGTGVVVGTLSDSYNCLGGAPAGVASDDLPAGVNVLEDLSLPCTDATDEGRGMMEIIHDVAPGASQAFHTAFNGQANFARGIIELATTAGAKVINDDVIFFAEPFYQDGILAQAVNTVKGMGVAYFSSAGNEGRQAYESAFRPSGVFAGSSELHDFDPDPALVDICQRITVPVGAILTLVYQWDQPFASATIGGPGSQSDLDIVLTDAACTTGLVASTNPNVGRDPVEVLGFRNPGPGTTFGVIIGRFSGPSPGSMKMVNVGSSAITFDEFGTKTGTSWGHSAALGGLGVGAADYRETPGQGQDPPLIEDFSSAGGTPILFDPAGNRLPTPDDRQQPDITAPDGTDTTFFPPGGGDPDLTSFPNFFGTSAAAPHAAGVAALILERNPSIGPDALYSALKTTAVDMDDPATMAIFDTGFDCASGFGLIQAEAALGASLPPPPPPPPPLPAGCFVAPPPPPILCNGRVATIVGTDGDDHLLGTPGNDVIHGLAGHDVITGFDGNDVICGGPGRDQLFGNRGKDRLFGGAGRDVLKGGPGSDRLFGQNGNDAMDGQSGSDHCNGGNGNDTAAGCESTAQVP